MNSSTVSYHYAFCNQCKLKTLETSLVIEKDLLNNIYLSRVRKYSLVLFYLYHLKIFLSRKKSANRYHLQINVTVRRRTYTNQVR